MTAAIPVVPEMNPGSQRETRGYWLLATLLAGAIFFQKFSFPVGGDVLPVCFLVILGMVAAGVYTRTLILHPLRSVFVFLFIAIATLTQAFSPGDFSLGAIGLLAVSYAPYLFRLSPDCSSNGRELEFFQTVSVILATLGLIQFFLQFAVGVHYAFFLDTLPQEVAEFVLHTPHMNSLIPLYYGSEIMKSNGILLNEPSFMCQYLAIAIIIELIYFMRWWRLALFTTGIAVTFSGTGLFILIAIVPFILLHQKRIGLLTALIALAALAPLWAPIIGLEHTLNRAQEFTTDQSSGYARFISPFRLLQDYTAGDAQTFFFGAGAGSIRRIVSVDYAYWDPTWGKLMFEYGLLGLLAFLPFTLHLFCTGPRSGFLKAALALAFFVMGGNLSTPFFHAILLCLLAWPTVAPSPAPERRVAGAV